MSRNKSNTDIVTHTFNIITINNKTYWFESSWSSNQGLHEVKSYKDVIEKLRDHYGEQYSYDVYTYNTAGLDNHLSNSEFFKAATKNLIEKK